MNDDKMQEVAKMQKVAKEMAGLFLEHDLNYSETIEIIVTYFFSILEHACEHGGEDLAIDSIIAVMQMSEDFITKLGHSVSDVKEIIKALRDKAQESVIM